MVLFAVEGNKAKGYGHVIRASVLARSCLGRGLEVSFVCAGTGRVRLSERKRVFPKCI